MKLHGVKDDGGDIFQETCFSLDNLIKIPEKILTT